MVRTRALALPRVSSRCQPRARTAPASHAKKKKKKGGGNAKMTQTKQTVSNFGGERWEEVPGGDAQGSSGSAVLLLEKEIKEEPPSPAAPVLGDKH